MEPNSSCEHNDPLKSFIEGEAEWPNDATSNRALGSILGAFVGDAAGSVLEFVSFEIDDAAVDRALEFKDSKQHRLVGGQITDDSEMAL